MPETPHVGMRLPELTLQQINHLIEWGFERDRTKIVIKAIDRQWTQELAARQTQKPIEGNEE